MAVDFLREARTLLLIHLIFMNRTGLCFEDCWRSAHSHSSGWSRERRRASGFCAYDSAPHNVCLAGHWTEVFPFLLILGPLRSIRNIVFLSGMPWEEGCLPRFRSSMCPQLCPQILELCSHSVYGITQAIPSCRRVPASGGVELGAHCACPALGWSKAEIWYVFQ